MSYDLPTCKKCGIEYSLRDDCEQSEWCDLCAQELLPQFVAVIKSALRDHKLHNLCTARWPENAHKLMRNAYKAE